MIREITFGQYFAADSVLHRLDPRVKLSVTFVLIFFIFLCKSFPALLLITLFTLLAAALSRVSPVMFIKCIKPVFIILIFTCILNIIYTTGGDTYFEWWKIKITEKGVNTAIFTMVRILVLVITSSLLTYTTTPTMLTDALERLLSPLKKLHIRVDTLAMMMTLALRFIPTLIEEIDRIMSAQKSRGADFETGSLIDRAKALVPIFVPLMVSSFRRAYDLALAMTCRCYTCGGERTRMKQMKMHFRDYMVILVILFICAGVIALNRMFTNVI